MTCILVEVRDGLSAAAAKFLGFVATLAAVVQVSQGRPSAPSFLAPDGDAHSPLSSSHPLSCLLWGLDLFQTSLTGPLSFSSPHPYLAVGYTIQVARGQIQLPFPLGSEKSRGGRSRQAHRLSHPGLAASLGHGLLRLIYQKTSSSPTSKVFWRGSCRHPWPVSCFGHHLPRSGSL